MKNNQLTRLSVAIGLSIATTSAMASPQSFMSSRSFGMAGTGVAVAHPASAPTDNPALMAGDHHDWSDDFGLILPSANIQAADEEEVIDQIDDIQDSINQLNANISSFEGAPSESGKDAVQAAAADVGDRLEKFDQDTVRTNLGAGLSLAVPSKAVSVGFFANANLTATVRGDLSDQDLATIDTIANAADATDLENQLNNAGITDANGDINLTSEGQVLASAVGEVGVSFARQFDLSNGNVFQLGLSPKYMELRTFQYNESVSGFDDENADADENMTEDNGFNVDIGAAYRFGEEGQWNTGMVVKNLIPMELDSVDKQYTLHIDPMVTAGIAHSGEYHVVTAELDLTKKEAFGFEDDTQWLAVGAEFDAWRYAQLRVGVRQNLASNDDNDGIAEETQFTAGLGVNLMGVRFDLGALYSDADVGAALEFGTAF
ncbi:conjugal transfer protein TraF [Marinobacter sp. chi1]|uniref:Conjugal transfer protein TraF n=1 Tax=Marinobacter suaedae TaxID=3057675 RepID=A0ABT8VXU4_9GAMM|nr:conjugal transfer protein TraF [Marinobacter sp. chi1]MDO3720779.1 conjugal transfer protein TraF [Marinobacter sp. chi1]